VAGGYAIYRWNGSGWDAMPGGGTNISVGDDGKAFVVNNAGQVSLWR
jgi:hypothetical protein